MSCNNLKRRARVAMPLRLLIPQNWRWPRQFVWRQCGVQILGRRKTARDWSFKVRTKMKMWKFIAFFVSLIVGLVVTYFVNFPINHTKVVGAICPSCPQSVGSGNFDNVHIPVMCECAENKILWPAFIADALICGIVLFLFIYILRFLFIKVKKWLMFQKN